MCANNAFALAMLTATVVLLAPGRCAAAELPAHGLALQATLTGDYYGLPAQDDPKFGFSVSMDGNWLAVGAPETIVNFGSGSAYGQGRHGGVFLYHFEGHQWVLRRRYFRGSYGDSKCGYSVSLELPWLLVGCPGGDPTAPAEQIGFSYFVHLEANGVGGYAWGVPVGPWAPGDDASAACGTTVAVSDGAASSGFPVIAMGCPGELGNSGVVWTSEYLENGADVQQLFASDADSYDRFGASLSLYVDHAGVFGKYLLAVGAPHKDLGAGSLHGKVYLFNGTSGNWAEQDSMTPADPANYSVTLFGEGLALADDTLIIGVTNGYAGYDPYCSGSIRCGVGHRYFQTGSNWVLVTPNAVVRSFDNDGGNPPGAQPGMEFGKAVALGSLGSSPDLDEVVAIGAPGTDGFKSMGGALDGTGYVALRSATTLSISLGELRPPVGFFTAANGRFGDSLDFGSQHRLAVGAPDWGYITFQSGLVRKGAVFIFGTDRVFQDSFDD